MAAKKTVKKGAQKPAKRVAASDKASNKTSSKTSKGFTDDERAAMRERAKELKRNGSRAEEESAVLAKLAEMATPDRATGERLHALIMATAPELTPRTWYGMPAYAKDGNVICFFQAGQKFKTRYSTLGFSDKAALDDGDVWPTSFALTKLTPAVETRIVALIKKAVG